MPIDFDRPRDVPLGVEEHIFIRLDNSDVRLVQVVRHPGGGNQYVRMCISGHLATFSSK